MGGDGGIVEADETYFGDVPNKAPRPRKQRKGRPYTRAARPAPATSAPSSSLVERGGKVRSFHVADRRCSDGREDRERKRRQRERGCTPTKAASTSRSAQHFAAHETVNHSAKEYARGDVHTNSVEGYFSIFKRGMKGVYQHCDEKHLHRYLAEFDFRYNNRVALGCSDIDRTMPR